MPTPDRLEPARTAVNAIAGAAVALSGGWLLHGRRAITVFVFHNVTETPSVFETRHHLALTPSELAVALAWIGREYEPVEPAAVDRGALPERAALVTFDDGFEGALTTGVELLGDASMPAVFFLNGAVVAGEGNAAAAAVWKREMGTGDAPPPDYEGRYARIGLVQSLDGRPGVTFGNHLWNHWETASLDDEALGSAYRRHAVLLAELRSSVPWFAATSGSVARRQLPVLRRAGARRVFSGAGVRNLDATSFLLHRVDLSRWAHRGQVAAGRVVVSDLLGRVRRADAR